MNIKIVILIFVLASFSLATSTKTKILPLGNSITQGDNNHNPWRRYLWLMLQENGFKNIDFIGTLYTCWGGLPPNQDFDMNHEGHWGWRADEIRDKIPTWLKSYIPDIVLLHIGHNDIHQNQSNEMTLSEIKQIIQTLRKANQSVIVLLAQIIPTTYSGANTLIEQLNEKIPLIAAELHTNHSPVSVVDHYTGYYPPSDNFDGVHPNNIGAQKMAKNWYSVLINYLNPPQIKYPPGNQSNKALFTISSHTQKRRLIFTMRPNFVHQQIGIYNGNGRLVTFLTSPNHRFTWDTSQFPRGCYVVKAKAGDETVMKQIILY